MRTLVKLSFPTDTMNELIESGKLGEKIDRILRDLKPEAAYFTTNEEGERGGFLVIDMKDASELPRIAEPFFLDLNARVTFQPIMNVDDLKKGLASIGQLAAAGRG